MEADPASSIFTPDQTIVLTLPSRLREHVAMIHASRTKLEALPGVRHVARGRAMNRTCPPGSSDRAPERRRFPSSFRCGSLRLSWMALTHP